MRRRSARTSSWLGSGALDVLASGGGLIPSMRGDGHDFRILTEGRWRMSSYAWTMSGGDAIRHIRVHIADRIMEVLA